MPQITSLGVGSGLDLNGMVEQLVALERRPLQTLQQQASQLQTKVSAFGKLTSLMGAMQDAANKLGDAPLWKQSLATSSDDTAVTAVGGSSAAAGSYQVQVTRLAGAQTLSSGRVWADASTGVGRGTMSIQLGSWNEPPTAFTAKTGSSSVDISVEDSDTLATLRDKINAAGAGVTATLVTDASGVRLSLRSSDTGAENGFRVAVVDNDGSHFDDSGLSALAYDPEAGQNQLQLKQRALNAQATVNGIAVESATNELSSVIDGLTLRLRKVTTGAVDIDVAPDRKSVTDAVKAFADAYNALAKELANQTKYNAETKAGGPLQGDSTAVGVMGQLRSLVGAASPASATFARLSDLGLSLQRDGTLAVNATKLDAAAANLAELKKAFTTRDTAAPENNGFARRFSDLAKQLTGVDGGLATRTEGLRSRIDKNSKSQDRVQDRVERFRARLVAQYSAMDANLSKLNALGSYVSQQMSALSRSGNSR